MPHAPPRCRATPTGGYHVAALRPGRPGARGPLHPLEALLLVLVSLHAAAAVVALALGPRLGRRVLLVCGLAPLATSIWAAAQAPGVLDGAAVTQRASWVPALGVEATFRLDGFALLMVALVSGIGTLIFAYAAAYFSDQPHLGRFAATLVAFAGSMLGLVLADNILLLFVFWELTSITSYLLIGFEDTKGPARAAALQAMLITGGGGLALLGGLVLLGQAAGTFELSEILAATPGGTAVEVALVLVLLGAFTKSAQAPFHSWLPGAMAAPTPVSAYLHSATMVKAGVYLIARMAPGFAETGLWRPLVLTVGAATMLVGGYRALRQRDLKLLLAYGTVSQLGFMVVLLGAGRPDTTFAGAALLLAHGAFKAALFMVVGVIDHQAHTRDLRELSGLGRRLRGLAVLSVVAGASMAGLPPLFGFIAKEAAFEGLLHLELGTGGTLVIAAVVAGSALTFAYTARFLWGAFATKPAATGEGLTGPAVPRPAWTFVTPAALLAALTAVTGLLPAPLNPLVGQAGVALDPTLDPPNLYLWHGLNTALLLSAVTMAVGTTLFLLRDRIERWQAGAPGLPSAEGGYNASVAGVMRLATRVTAVVQNGSLPTYLTVIILTILILPGVPLAARASLPEGLVWWDRPLQAGVAVLVVVAALATAVARRRFAAVLFLGAVGYGVAVLFVVQGAPDLALTQFLVETLAVVLFVFVLRSLPERFHHVRWLPVDASRVAVSAAVGVFVAGFALLAAAARTEPSVSAAYLEQSLPEAGGRNVVNVILVDFRALDTLGEITVLAVAAVGIVSLVGIRRRRGQAGTGTPSAVHPGHEGEREEATR